MSNALSIPGSNRGVVNANSQEAMAIFGGSVDRQALFGFVEASDLLTPRLKLAQGIDKNVQNPDNKLIAGDFYNQSTLEKVFPAATGGWVIPLYLWKELIQWNPDKKAEKSKKVLAKAIDLNTIEGRKLADMVARRVKVADSRGREQNAVTEYYHFLVICPDISWTQPFQLSFAKSSHKFGKQWLNRLMNLVYTYNEEVQVDQGDGTFRVEPVEKKIAGAPIFSTMFHLRSDVAANDEGENYFVPQIGGTLNVDKSQFTDLHRQQCEAIKALANGKVAETDDGEPEAKEVSAERVANSEV